MPPSMQRFGGAPNSIASHYQQYPSHSQAHTAGLSPPSFGGNTSFMNPNSNINPFANGNALSLAQGFGSGSGSGSGSGGGLGGVGAATGLGSHAAQIGFHGASLQQAHNSIGEQGVRVVANKGRIREVWKSNLQEEMDTLRRLVDKYPYISMVRKSCGI
jgi:CCR4-NOT transcription complex subunit 7/8